MAIKGWFRGARDKAQQEYTVDDLIVLERYDEAAERLREKLKANQQDLHSRLKLAEVYSQLGRTAAAVEEYSFVADEYAQDGFYDKGLALLAKASRLAPGDLSLGKRIAGLQQEKSMEHVRELAIEGLRHARGMQDGTSALELQRLWHNMAASVLVRHLSGEQLKKLFSLMQLVHLPERSTLAERGGTEGALMLIVRGVVEVWAPGEDNREALIRSFGAGDVIGEAALLERLPWPATYRVTEAMTILALGREGLEKSLVANPDPRGFLEALRSQRSDRDVAAALARLRSA